MMPATKVYDEPRGAALVTGASRGIGRSVALALADVGYDLVVNFASSEAAAHEVVEEAHRLGRRAVAVQADISKPDQRKRLVERALEEFGRIALLVNNAGIAPRQRLDILDSSEESFDEVIAVNLKGPYFLTQLVARSMIEAKRLDPGFHPRIVTITSVSAEASSPNRGEYCVAKAGLSMMTRLFAHRLAEYGIPVVEVRPGIIQTDMTAPVRERYEKLIHEGVVPFRRWGAGEDVARVVVAVALGYLDFCTGSAIYADGGLHIPRL